VRLITTKDLNERIPFAYEGDMHVIRRGLTHRIKVIRRFMGLETLACMKALDIGASNKFSRALGVEDNTLLTDLNREIHAPDKDYEVVTCFEIFEHNMNPLGMMDFIYDILKPGGVCYFSCPSLGWLGFYQGPNHFTEYKRSQLERMFRYVGFEIVKYKKFNLWDPWFIFFGFRPAWRVLFNRTHLFELRKP
jgi:hypothetical protein